MKQIIPLLLIFASVLNAAEQPTEIVKELEPFRPLLGKTWKGALRSSTAEKPVQDVMKWERALNGKAARILHSINNGEYGGETIIMWNAKTARLEFHYFTTAGFTTHGHFIIENGKFISHEEVTGNDGGVTEVKATTEFLPDGRLRVKSRYLKRGEWVDGHEVTYAETPGAEVAFK